MKKIILYSALSLVLATVGCEDEYEAPDTLCDVTWIVNQIPSSSMERNQGDFMSILDCSINPSSHMWSIEEGNCILNSGFDDDSELTDYINAEKTAALETTDELINVLFNNPGTNKIRLYNTFEEKVTWNGSVPLTSYYDEEIDKWVIDTCLEVYVFEIIEPAAAVYKVITEEIDGETISTDSLILEMGTGENYVAYELEDSASWKEISLMAGESLKVVDISTTGEATGRAWSFAGGSISSSSDSIATVYFYSLGNFRVHGLTGSRSWPNPVLSVRNNIPLRITVGKSTLPFTASATSGASEQSDETIYLPLSGQIGSVPLGAEADFTVHVSNTTSGYDADIAVKSISKNSSDATQLAIVLTEAIYNSDDITISYKGASSPELQILSSDERVLEPFSDVEVSMYMGTSILSSTCDVSMDFETEDGTNPSYGWWASNVLYWYRSTDYFYGGSASVCVKGTDMNTGGSWMQATIGTIPAGSYFFRCSFFVTSSNTSFDSGGGLRLTLKTPWLFKEFDMSSVTKDTWVTLDTDTYTTTAEVTSETLIAKVFYDGATHFYMDNLQMFAIETRP